MNHRFLLWLAVAAVVGISALLWTGRVGEPSLLEQAMARHGLTAANIVYGHVDGDPVQISINAPPGLVRPYYSLAKPMTAAIALQHLDLDQVVAGATVRQLLQHSGGWDRAIAGDPVTEGDETADCTRLPVPERQFRPGERYAYSNLGYCLIGRAVAEQTGVAFPEAARSLYPEAQSMRYDPWLGPAGGWAGTAADYFRFALRPVHDATRENPRPRPDDIPYGLGWGIGPDYLVHFGVLGSNFALVVKQGDFAAVGLFDGRPPDGGAAARELRTIFLDFNVAGRTGT